MAHPPSHPWAAAAVGIWMFCNSLAWLGHLPVPLAGGLCSSAQHTRAALPPCCLLQTRGPGLCSLVRYGSSNVRVQHSELPECQISADAAIRMLFCISLSHLICDLGVKAMCGRLSIVSTDRVPRTLWTDFEPRAWLPAVTPRQHSLFALGRTEKETTSCTPAATRSTAATIN